MHVFLAGATGVLGRRITPLVIAGGHRVTGLARSSGSAERLRAWGAEVALADATDEPALVAAVAAAGPDVVMNQLTDLGHGVGRANSELRTTAARTVSAAVRRAGVRRVVTQSVSWVYAPGDGPATEDEPLDLDAEVAGVPRAATTRALALLEESTREAPEWVVLRYGMLYGPETWYAADGERAEAARRAELATGPDVTSFVHVDDAARAAVAALTWPSGDVNVVDDRPATASEWVPAFAEAVGAGPQPEAPMTTPWARGADNTRLHERGFELAHPTWWPHFGL